MFRILHRVLNSLERIRDSTDEVLRAFHRDGCVYLELRTTPRNLPARGDSQAITKREYAEAILDQISETLAEINGCDCRPAGGGKQPGPPKFQMHCNLLLSVDRTRGLEEALDTVQLAHQLQARQEALQEEQGRSPPSPASPELEEKDPAEGKGEEEEKMQSYGCRDHRPKLVGIDFSGNPTVAEFSDYLPAFQLAREYGTVRCSPSSPSSLSRCLARWLD